MGRSGTQHGSPACQVKAASPLASTKPCAAIVTLP